MENMGDCLRLPTYSSDMTRESDDKVHMPHEVLLQIALSQFVPKFAWFIVDVDVACSADLLLKLKYL
jgi:hypothetical protein